MRPYSWKRVVFRVSRPVPLLILLVLVFFAGGYFYIRSLGRLEFYARHHAEVQFVKKLTNVFFLPSFFSGDKLERYDLTIEDDDLKFLNQNLPELYQGNILTDEYKKPVKAKFASGQDEYEVQVRYRGDTDNHWRDPQKSWRVIFPNDRYFKGEREINLIIPVDRYYLMEELSFYRARKLGLPVFDTKFVNLFVNGKRQGVYWQVGEWSKDILEEHGFSGDTNLYGGRDFAELVTPTDSVFDNIHAWRKYADDPYSQASNYADLDALLDLVNNASDEKFAAEIGNILNLENFYKWLLVQQLVSSSHQAGSNLRFFFDPTSGRFHFLPWDVSVGHPPLFLNELAYGKIANRILSNPEMLLARNRLFWQYLQDDANLEDDLGYYDKLDRLTKNNFYKDYRKVESNLKYRKRIQELRRLVVENFEGMKQNLEHANAIVTITREPEAPITKIKLATESFSGAKLIEIKIEPEACAGRIQVYGDGNRNEMFDDTDPLLSTADCVEEKYRLALDWAIMASRAVSKEGFLVPGYNETNIFIVSNSKIASQLNGKILDLDIRNLITGEKAKEVTQRFVIENQEFDLMARTQRPAEFVSQYPMFTLSADGLRLKRGVHRIEKDTIIPANTHLIIEPGTQIFLGRDVSILSYSPVTAIGDPGSPIVFQGLEGSWGTFGVVDAGASSTFDNLIMKGGGEDIVNGAFMSGMLSLFRSPGIIVRSRFEQAYGDDAVNIKYGIVGVQNSRFENNAFDGLDIDFSSSLIKENIFSKNGNDGIDISGERPLIVGNVISYSGDKCISVGESSKAVLFNNLLIKCNIGIAIKDSSDPVIVNQTIVKSKIGISGYQKKQIFRGGKGVLLNSIIWDNEKSIELDSVSSLKAESSIVQGGYEGSRNLDLNPEFSEGYKTLKNELKGILNQSIYTELGPGFEPLPQAGYIE